MIGRERDDVEGVVLLLDGFEEGIEQITIGQRLVHLNFIISDPSRTGAPVVLRQQVFPVCGAANHTRPVFHLQKMSIKKKIY